MAALAVACGETLRAQDDVTSPDRDAGGDGATGALVDAAIDTSATGDANGDDASGGDGGPGGVGWQCAAPQMSTDHSTPSACNDARGASGCNLNVYPPDAGSSCDPDAQATQVFCTTCRQINAAYFFDTVFCTCQN
jgi:hypothetical protein